MPGISVKFSPTEKNNLTIGIPHLGAFVVNELTLLIIYLRSLIIDLNIKFKTIFMNISAAAAFNKSQGWSIIRWYT